VIFLACRRWPIAKQLTVGFRTIESAAFGSDSVSRQTQHRGAAHAGMALPSLALTCLDVCVRKPLVATASLDCAVRLWNWQDASLELFKQFSDEALSVALAPNGLLMLVGFADKLRLMTVLMDDLKARRPAVTILLCQRAPVRERVVHWQGQDTARICSERLLRGTWKHCIRKTLIPGHMCVCERVQVYHEFAVKGCRSVAFSNGGQHFAAVNGSLVQLHSTHTCEPLGTLRGHSGNVTALLWSADDSRIYSAGKDGAVYEWRVSDMKREKEHVQKGCQYSAVAATADCSAMVVAGSDCLLKELEEHANAGTQVKHEVETGVPLTHVHLTKARVLARLAREWPTLAWRFADL
jgi:cilia- and flagella-associated protein 57